MMQENRAPRDEAHDTSPESVPVAVPEAANTVWPSMTDWDLVLPPSRPSRDHLNFINNALSRIGRNSPVAVLGATPEYRDLLAENDFSEIVLFDRNPGFVRKMTSLRVYSNTETLIEGDWRDTLRNYHNEFGAILSDYTSGNIPYDDRRDFYADISQALAYGGVFIDRHLRHRIQKLLPLADVITYYQNAPLNLAEINRFNCEVLFRSELLIGREIVDSTEIYEFLDHTYMAMPRILSFAKQSQRVTPRGGIWWYGRDWPALRSDYCPALEPIQTLREPRYSPYHGIGLCMALRREKPDE